MNDTAMLGMATDATGDEGRPEQGEAGLAKELIKLAFKDYMKLREAGMVQGIKVITPFKSTKILEGAYRKPAQVEELITFLVGHGLEDWLDIADLHIEPAYLLRRVGIAA